MAELLGDLLVTQQYGLLDAPSSIQQPPPDLLMVKKNAHPTELADLFGARFVPSVEVDEGKRPADSLVKQLTGGERIKAPRMGEHFWEFEPTHTMIVAANHRPEVRGTDKGIWRRIKIVPWDVEIPESEKDPRLPEKLENELKGILAWAVRACLDWQRYGLAPPPKVEAETEEYRAEQDTLAGFIADRCVEGPEYSVKSDPLYVEYKKWCQLNGEKQEAQDRFAVRMKETGYEKIRTKSARIWRGIALRSDSDPSPDDGPVTDPSPRVSPIDKPNRETDSVRGDGCDTDFGLSARAPYAIFGVNRKNPSPPVTPSPEVTRVNEEVGE